jgi:hypothetical protein
MKCSTATSLGFVILNHDVNELNEIRVLFNLTTNLTSFIIFKLARSRLRLKLQKSLPLESKVSGT